MFAARHNTSLQSITLDGCVQLTDEAFVHLGRGAKHATLVAAQGCGKLTNGGFGPLARGCKHLKALNLSYCGGVNNETLIVVAKALKQLELFHCAFCTDVTDAGVYALATTCAQSKLRSLDVSFCASLSDDGVSAVAERCAALEYLNLSGLHRVTDAAALRVTHNLWRLRTLCLEDLHLITDSIFFFDAKKDGRAAARQQMYVCGVRRLVLLNRRVDFHAIDATPARWRRLFLLGRASCVDVPLARFESTSTPPVRHRRSS